MNSISHHISEIGIVPVAKLKDPKRDAVPLACVLCASGIPVAEITFRAAGADAAVRLMKEAHPEMIIGVGTVVTIEQIERAVVAGAQFIVTPGFDAELVSYSLKKGLPIYPGCITPTDYHQALKFELEILKFFPAEQAGGLERIKAMSAPFPQFKIMPTGGISLKNLKKYISDPVIAACGGSYMVAADLIEKGKWDEIGMLCKETVKIIKEARNNG